MRTYDVVLFAIREGCTKHGCYHGACSAYLIYTVVFLHVERTVVQLVSHLLCSGMYPNCISAIRQRTV